MSLFLVAYTMVMPAVAGYRTFNAVSKRSVSNVSPDAGWFRRWRNDTWRKMHGWRVVTLDGVKTWVKMR